MVPGAQGAQLAAAPAATVPGAHAVHAPDPAGANVPAAQG
jgi:hypothetical protein